MIRFVFALLAGAVVSTAARAGEGCEILGAIAVEAVKAKATQACVLTGQPIACSVSAALNSAAVDGLAKKGTTAGCEWTVRQVGKVFHVTLKAKDKAGADAARAAETELKKAKEYRPK